MKKNYNTPKMLMVNVKSASLLVNASNTPADPTNPVLSKKRLYEYEEELYYFDEK